VPGSTPFVDNDLLSSLGETLLVFEHLFDTEYRGVSRVVGRVKQWGWRGGGVAGLAGWRDYEGGAIESQPSCSPSSYTCSCRQIAENGC
jgi:hypothetical protein